MKNLLYILLLSPLFVQAQNIQFYLTNKGDSIFCKKIEMANYELSCKGAIAHHNDSVISLSPEKTVLYRRGKETFVSGKFENKTFDSLLFYKIEENGKLFKLYSSYVNGKKRYYLLEKKNELLVEVTPKYFEKNLSKRLRKNKNLSTKLKDKKYCFDQLADVIHEANNNDFVAETSADLYRNPKKKIPIYMGAYDPNEKGKENKIEENKNGSKNHVPERGNNSNSEDEDECSQETEYRHEESIKRKGDEGSGENEKTKTSYRTKLKKRNSYDWLYINTGLHTGIDYLSNSYFHQGVPLGLNIGGDFSVGLLQRYLRVGISGNRTAIPYVNRGNII